MIAAIRIHGQVKIDHDVEEALFRLRMRRKYACVILPSARETEKALKKLRNFIAYGEISDAMLERLIQKRGKAIDKSKIIDVKKVAAEIAEGKDFEKVNLKQFFRLHPPRGGIRTKLHYPRGALGDHKEKINELIERML